MDPEAARENIQRLTAVWLRLTNDQRDALLSLAGNVETIGPNGIGILTLLGDRLALGSKQYGDFNDERDMLSEIIPEHADALVYLLCHSMRMQKLASKTK